MHQVQHALAALTAKASACMSTWHVRPAHFAESVGKTRLACPQPDQAATQSRMGDRLCAGWSNRRRSKPADQSHPRHGLRAGRSRLTISVLAASCETRPCQT